MRNLIQRIRQEFHPLFHARKSAFGRMVIRLLNQPAWLTVQGVNFKVRGRLLTHGLAFAVIGSQEENPEALITACMRHLRLRSFRDVGANIGHYTLLMKTVDPQIETVLIEPLPTNQALIRDTLKRNTLQKTTLIPAAVSDGSGDGIINADSMAGQRPASRTAARRLNNVTGVWTRSTSRFRSSLSMKLARIMAWSI
jgi:FkbM family methyltransferase